MHQRNCHSLLWKEKAFLYKMGARKFPEEYNNQKKVENNIFIFLLIHHNDEKKRITKELFYSLSYLLFDSCYETTSPR